GLLHISEASHYHVKAIQELFTLGQVIDVQIIKISDKKLSLSVKSLQPTPWQLFMEKHQVGEKVTAVVVKKMQNGMLLEVEREVSGLISKFDYSWNINENLAGKVQLGEKVEVQITSIDPVKQQFTLSKKHLEYNPWADIHFQQGEHISGTVKTIQEKGAIIEVNGVEGYLPISELSDDRVEKVDSIIKVGEIHTLEVVECYPKEWKLKLSLRRVLQKESQKEYDAIKKDNVSGNQPLADLFSKFKK
ncbi:MAG: S1 RNA-binding domain-containing protein, partial [Candidatus Izemoplasmatales bacterium]|nr:S1 RNA-binding domain-containing protein [Candidatus Izemoplasmatales bacterium]